MLSHRLLACFLILLFGVTPSVEPEFTIDDTQKIVDLTIRVDEQRQYYVKEVQFLGMDQKLGEKLRAEFPKSIWIFDSERLENFF